MYTKEEWNEYQREYQRKYRERHRDEIRAYNREYQKKRRASMSEEEKQRMLDRQKEYNKERRKKYQRKRTLNLDIVIKEQEDIMTETFGEKDKNPSQMLRYYTARAMKVYLLHSYALQKGIEFSGEWIDRNGESVCSVCWVPRRWSDLDGLCVNCGAHNGK